MTPAATVGRLEAARTIEKEQALIYRDFAARAEASDDPDLAQRFHDLHADEQHHLSRLTARILELGGRPADLGAVRARRLPAAGWEEIVREREEAEIALYRALLDTDLDEATRALIDSIVAVEIRHATELGGKWTVA